MIYILYALPTESFTDKYCFKLQLLLVRQIVHNSWVMSRLKKVLAFLKESKQNRSTTQYAAVLHQKS